MNPWYMSDKLALLAIVLVAFVVVLVSSAAHVQAAPSDVPPCVEAGTAEGQTLYMCDTDFGVRCIWDPSELLSAGVVDCEW